MLKEIFPLGVLTKNLLLSSPPEQYVLVNGLSGLWGGEEAQASSEPP